MKDLGILHSIPVEPLRHSSEYCVAPSQLQCRQWERMLAALVRGPSDPGEEREPDSKTVNLFPRRLNGMRTCHVRGEEVWGVWRWAKHYPPRKRQPACFICPFSVSVFIPGFPALRMMISIPYRCFFCVFRLWSAVVLVDLFD